MTDYLASIKRDITSTDVTYRADNVEITKRTAIDAAGNLVSITIYVGGWRLSTYKTINGATRALKRLGVNA